MQLAARSCCEETISNCINPQLHSNLLPHVPDHCATARTIQLLNSAQITICRLT